MRSPRRLLLAALLVVAGALTLGTTPAAAHEGPGILTVETDEPTATGHRYVIRLVWQNDGHPAARDTTVTATPFTPDGAPQTPIAMTPVDDDGRFEATVEMTQPGSWRVQFTSVSPVATVDHPVEVAAPTTTSTTADPTTSTASEESGASASGSGTEGTDAEADPTASEESDGGSGAGLALALVAVGVVAAVAVAGYVVLRRRPTADAAQESPGTAQADSTDDAGTRVES